MKPALAARPRPRRLRGVRIVPLGAAALLAALVLPAPASAELVVLDGGEVLKVASYEIAGEAARLTLPAGGVMTLPLLRVERIIDDEVPPEPEAPPALPGVVTLGFHEDQAVPATPFGELIYETARRHALNPQVVAALIRAESAFDSRAVSHKGARGLMQLMPATAHRFGVDAGQLFDPVENLEAGIRYLAWLGERFEGDLTRVLAAYNAGEGAVERYAGIPPYRETREYVKRIFSTLGLAPAGTLASL